jgi:RNA-binding protein YhbY
MDFENYSLGSLVKNRSNYDMKHRRYRRVRRQVLARVADLGWTQNLFKDIDRMIGARHLLRVTS